MARKLRIQYPGALYHVMNRGDRREAIFADDEDRERLLQTLTEACTKTGWQVHAYCLMRNHFEQADRRPGPSHFGEAVQEAETVQAERLVVEELKGMGWREADLEARRKGEPRKIALAWELRSRTTMPLAWIAERLRMGSRGHLAWLLQQHAKGGRAVPTGQALLEI
jgi:Transposase IS200 like